MTDEVQTQVNLRVRASLWRALKIRSVQEGFALNTWVTQAIEEKMARETGNDTPEN